MELFKENERDLFKPLPREEADRREYKGVELTDYAIINGATQAWFLDSSGIKDKKFLVVDRYFSGPIIHYASHSDLLISKNLTSIRPIKYVGEETEETIIYGEYPQELVYDKDLRKKLNEELNQSSLQETGKIYSSGEIEYIYKGQKYIRITIDMKEAYFINMQETRKSNFRRKLDNSHNKFEIKSGIVAPSVYSWIKVQPIVWTHHPEDDYAITKKILFGARPYEEMLKFLRDDLPKDIQPSDISNIFGVLSPEEQIRQLKEMKEQLLKKVELMDKILRNAEQKQCYDKLPSPEEIALIDNSIGQINDALQKKK